MLPIDILTIVYVLLLHVHVLQFFHCKIIHRLKFPLNVHTYLYRCKVGIVFEVDKGGVSLAGIRQGCTCN